MEQGELLYDILPPLECQYASTSFLAFATFSSGSQLLSFAE